MSQPAPATASTPGASLLPDSTDIFTIGHLALIALLAVLAIAGLIWGMRLARRRHEAEREVKVHNREIAGDAERRSGGDRRAAGGDDDAPRPSVSPGVANAPTELIFDKMPDVSPRYVTPMPEAAPPAGAAGAVTEILPSAEAASDEAADDAVTELLPATGGAEPTPAEEPVADAGPSPADGPVTQLKGLGPKLAAKLAEHGIATVGDLAALDDDQAAALDARLGPFTGRMARDRWQEQARFLAAGDRAGFEAVFGKL